MGRCSIDFGGKRIKAGERYPRAKLGRLDRWVDKEEESMEGRNAARGRENQGR